jgi:hypothetical protein
MITQSSLQEQIACLLFEPVTGALGNRLILPPSQPAGTGQLPLVVMSQNC